MIRRLVALVMTPNEVPPRLSLGDAKLGEFVMLNISQRSWARQRSATRKFLASSESKLIDAGPRTLGSVRDSLPKVNGAGFEKAAGLSQLIPRTPAGGVPLSAA